MTALTIIIRVFAYLLPDRNGNVMVLCGTNLTGVIFNVSFSLARCAGISIGGNFYRHDLHSALIGGWIADHLLGQKRAII